MVQLPGYAERSIDQLSGGQAQRVALARALIVDPPVLLLDEPLAALDLKLRQAMQVELREIQRRVGSTFVYVTHDQEEALVLSDRVVLMSEGHIVQQGAPRAVYRRPETLFAATFLGEANLFQGAVERRAGEARVLSSGIEFLVAVNGAMPDDASWVCLRPEQISMKPADDAPRQGPNSVRGRVAQAVFLGPRGRWMVDVPGERRVVVDAGGGRALARARRRGESSSPATAPVLVREGLTVGRGFAIRIAPSGLFLALFFIAPIAILFAYSFGSSSLLGLEFGTSLDNYNEVVSDYLFGSVYVRTLLVAVGVAVLSVMIAMPFAYAITLGPLRMSGDLLLFLVLCSLFTAYIVRVYAWRTLLGREGAINSALEGIGVIDQPLEFLLYNRFALVLALVNVLVPLAVLPLYSAFAGIDKQVIEASRSLGASPVKAFRHVTLPLASRGVVAGFVLCFVIAAGDYVTPQLVGGPRGLLVGNLIVSRFGLSFDWPTGSALAFTLILAMVLVIGVVILLLRILGIRDRPA